MFFLLQTRYFAVVLLVRAPSETMNRKPSFQLHSDKDLVNTDSDPISGLSIPNFIDKSILTMHSDGVTPWRGAREKTSIFMQMLIEACSAPGSRIVDLTVGTCINFYKLLFHGFFFHFFVYFMVNHSCFFIIFFKIKLLLSLYLTFLVTGSTLHACRASGRHFLGFEEDIPLFNAVLKPLLAGPSTLDANMENLHDDDDDDDDYEDIELDDFCT